MLKKSLIISSIFVLSTLVQLVTQIFVTKTFGASFELDVFLAAVAVPSIMITVVYGTLNNVLIPFFGKYESKTQLQSYCLSLIMSFGAVSMFLAGGFATFSKFISSLLYSGRGEEFVSVVATQMQYLSLSIPFAVIATILGAYFYYQKEFYRFPIAQVGGSIFNLSVIFFLSPYIGIWSLVVGFIFNIAFQILFVIPTHFQNISIRFVSIGPILIAWIPLVIGNFALRSDTILIRSFAAQLSTGYMVYLNLVMKIVSIATSVMTIGIQVLLLPHLVEYFQKKQYIYAASYIKKAKFLSIIIAAVITLSIMIFGPFAIKFLFEGGKFSSLDVKITISLLPYFIVPAVGWGIHGVFLQPLYALKKYNSVGLLNVSALGLAWITASIFTHFQLPLLGISAGISVLLYTGIIGSEIIWQRNKKNLT